MNTSKIVGSWGFVDPTHGVQFADRDFYHFLPDGNYHHEFCMLPPKQAIARARPYSLENDTLVIHLSIGSSVLKVISIEGDSMEIADSLGMSWQMIRLTESKPFMRRWVDSSGQLQNLDTAE